MAIALTQPRPEGRSWAEWKRRGLPRDGHTRCRWKCRCRLAPVSYINLSVVLSVVTVGGLSINMKGERIPITDRQAYLEELVSIWDESGLDNTTLALFGLTELQQIEEVQKQLTARGIAFITFVVFMEEDQDDQG